MMQANDAPFDHPANALVLEVFRLNGALIRFGDALVKPLGLTSARWQVLGSVAHGRGTFSVARLADNMGLARQSVQRIVDELAEAGLVGFAPNPAHKRAKLVVLTPRGERVFKQASEVWAPVADAMIAGADPRQLRKTRDALIALRERLDEQFCDRSS
ncbi:Transcriptional regulator SlyA [Rhodopseudomonas palustris]|uniref:MarR family winged helix-turn-helix transcriptional regulator n=1 Tax=Rhodopseudomonas palustris (strain ATCC BAA-98 / CGA009) TaxID=258594 RepID=Q6N8J4_RHOPA|nr:MarR family winged helix-turn-helix transcriptional regulator [Rhodopseudomonas palustris]OPF94097.1 MarR family transcriptional regulator [Rhodopseudomonas palustris]QQM03417.1 Transcriptional regulator SlyA [Rhodopseudomonas palustris]RJF62642.1 MarR family transcriptional regulator [Rhodopseudomonas palustris]WAB79573.1 MarR family winged helix-turn-helix transcriptional regulator [Rhodopseudomonas palustris]WCL92059.1 MarR family winged helix-turn-helix transcriptional regulator [Rhodop